MKGVSITVEKDQVDNLEGGYIIEDSSGEGWRNDVVKPVVPAAQYYAPGARSHHLHRHGCRGQLKFCLSLTLTQRPNIARSLVRARLCERTNGRASASARNGRDTGETERESAHTVARTITRSSPSASPHRSPSGRLPLMASLFTSFHSTRS